jgi:hypothetical protein
MTSQAKFVFIVEFEIFLQELRHGGAREIKSTLPVFLPPRWAWGLENIPRKQRPQPEIPGGEPTYV